MDGRSVPRRQRGHFESRLRLSVARSASARWCVGGCVESSRWTSHSGIGEFAVSTVNFLLDFQAVKSEFRAASDGRFPRDLCRFSAFADVRRSAAVRLQLAASLSFATRRRGTSVPRRANES